MKRPRLGTNVRVFTPTAYDASGKIVGYHKTGSCKVEFRDWTGKIRFAYLHENAVHGFSIADESARK